MVGTHGLFPRVAALQMLSLSFAAQAIAQACEANYPPPTASAKTTTFGPVIAPEFDTSDPVNLIPAPKISLYYGPSDPGHGANPSFAVKSGSVNMNLNFSDDAVVLEHINSIKAVECTDESVIVSFKNLTGFETALGSWSERESLILITNHLGNCDVEFERGFYKVDNLIPNRADLSITSNASKQQMDHIAESCEMSFSSVPAATLAKRITFDPSWSIPFSKALANDTVLYSYPPYLTVTADQAAFSSEITFSGYLYYDFWAFKLRELHFDVDAGFSADLAISANIAAAYDKSFSYMPSDLSYTLIDVPGIVKLGPGVAFGVDVDISASNAVDVTAGVSISMPNGNVHVDLLDSANTAASGWTPAYEPHANISAEVDVRADASASVTVQMAVNFLGGLIDLSSGVTAKPGIANSFSLDAHYDTEALKAPKTLKAPRNSTLSKTSQDSHDEENSCDQGVSWKSKLLFSLDAFVVGSWSKTLIDTGVPLLDVCYQF